MISNPDKNGLTTDDLKKSFLENLHSGLGRLPEKATINDLYTALSMTVLDCLFKQGAQTMDKYSKISDRFVAYFSAEFLPGPHLENNLFNLGVTEKIR